jgi:SAM-dependent methyltransferase
MNTAADQPLAEQLAYYGARAAEYDQWWHREGRYDRGAEENEIWFRESKELDAALEEFQPSGDILELACGTGLRTAKLLPFADSLTAVDGSAEMLAIHASRFDSTEIEQVQADLFNWTPSRQYDVVYFGFWLSHVPPDKFDNFWSLVRRVLNPGGRFFFVDSKRAENSAAADHIIPVENSVKHPRRLNDGREFQVYKVFYNPGELQRRLTDRCWTCEVRETDTFFIHGHGLIQNA